MTVITLEPRKQRPKAWTIGRTKAFKMNRR
jgi:hypothetical protein